MFDILETIAAVLILAVFIGVGFFLWLWCYDESE